MYYSNEINSAASCVHPGQAFSSNPPLARSAWASSNLHMGYISAPDPPASQPPSGLTHGLNAGPTGPGNWWYWDACGVWT